MESILLKVPGTSEGVAGRDIILLHRLLKQRCRKNGIAWLCPIDECVPGSDWQTIVHNKAVKDFCLSL